MLKQRVITAIVLLVVLIGAYMAGPVVLSGVMAIGFTVALWEWLKLAGINTKASALVAAVLGIGMSSLTYFAYQEIASGMEGSAALLGTLSSAFIYYVLFITLLWIGISIRVFFARHTGMKVAPVMVALSGIFFVPAAWLSFVGMYATFGISMILSLLVIVWVADIMAYFTGMAFGKHRMSPAISPKKSWEGAAGGMLSVILLGYAAAYFMSGVDTIPSVVINACGAGVWAVVAFFLVVLSIIGDLYESALKRQAGIKDSSNLLPGHGGFYDRMDALMPTLPAGFLTTILIVSSTAF